MANILNGTPEMINEFRDIISNYENIQSENPTTIISEATNLFNRFMPIYETQRDFEKQNSPYFNIFNLIGIGKLEAVLHTPFLENLLNPKGTHSQQQFFLYSFLQLFLDFNESTLNNIDYNYIDVSKEYSFKGGRIDILITYMPPDLEKRFAVIIENKIDAYDQHNQIRRYINHVDTVMNIGWYYVIYITKNGQDPSTDSINNEMLDNLKKAGKYKAISFSNDVSHWLKSIITTAKIQSPVLKYSIHQYIEVLKEFTHE